MDAAQQLLSLSQKELDQLPAELRQKIEVARKQVFAAKRLHTVQTARDSLLDFVEMSMPDPEFPDDVSKSRYETKPIHRYLAKKLEQVEKGEILRLIISVQPRVGKSHLVSKAFPAWLAGRDPYRQIIVGGYGDEFVKEFGREVRETMLSPFYNQVFPKTELRRNAKAANRQQTTAGGILHFVGMQGQMTGKGAHFLIVDDPIKNDEEARSKAAKDRIWSGFMKDAMSRLMGGKYGAGGVVITATRWAEDDLIGRITNPKLGYVPEDEAAKWTVINIPAFAEDDDPLGREPGELLWPERTPEAFLNSFRKMEPAGFAALYMGRPAPPEGNFITRDNIRGYQAHQLPANLRYYAASDHAISQEQRRDSTCMGVVGVDSNDNIYILPDLVWAQLDAEDQVEAMMNLMRAKRPLSWWAEKGHISKSIGPFLRKRMLEEEVYCSIIEKTPVKDKQTRAQSIQARMSMGKVFFPVFAPWYAEAVEQMLNFPNGAHDDFCVTGDSLVTMADGRYLPISQVKSGDRVMTPNGARRVTAAALTDLTAEVMRVTFSDGTWLDATANHPVSTKNGFVRVDGLTSTSVVHCDPEFTKGGPAWQSEEARKLTWWNTEDTDTVGIRTAHICHTGNTITGQSRVGGIFTGIFGKTLTALSQKITTYTTKTMTRWTMLWKIWSVCQRGNTGPRILVSAVRRLNTWLCWTRYALWLLLGTNRKRVGSGTPKWCPQLGINVSGPRLAVSTAVNGSAPLFPTGQDFVAPIAEINTGIKHTTNVSCPAAQQTLAHSAVPRLSTINELSVSAGLNVGTKRVVSVERLPGRQPVFNLTVEGEHVYYVNGTLTHNCDFIAWIGIGLSSLLRADAPVQHVKEEPKSGSLEWILKSSDRIRKQNASTERTARYLH